jgi:preprotein translocase subunit SecD
VKRRKEWTSILIFLGVVGLCLGLTFWKNNKPLLGLDLQGGISAVLQPIHPDQVSKSQVSVAKEIIRNRVDGLGVAEPDIVAQGKSVVVQLPGVKDPDKAKQVIGTTAKMEFRPVMQQPVAAPAPSAGAATGSSTAPSPSSTPASPATATSAPAAPGSTTATTGAVQQRSLGSTGGAGVDPAAAGSPQAFSQGGGGTTTPSTTAPPATTAPAGSAPTTTAAPANPATVAPPSLETPNPCTAYATQVPSGGVVLPDASGTQCYILGPIGFEGEALSTAQAALANGEWVVNVTVKGSKQGVANQHMNACFSHTTVCPTGMSAIILDNKVLSAPVVQAQDLASNPNGFQISGSFTHSSASELALQLRYGSLPVQFKPATFQQVSATLGQSSLHAGLIAGIVGLAAVALYMLIFYRLLGLVAILSLATGAGLLWAIIAYLGEHSGLALTLAGITGIIVSIGVAVDSNVVFYEHLREDMAKGRTLRGTVKQSFREAWKTIVAADVVSLIAAAILYFLTVGSVRGFAFYLGLSTILDLVASWFFMRPLAFIMAESDWFQSRPGLLGVHTPKELRAAHRAARLTPAGAGGGAATVSPEAEP